MAVAFLLDEDIHPATAPAARKLGLDVVGVHELDRCGPAFPDRDQLRFAASEGRVMVTRNRDDYITLTREFFGTGETHRGLLIIPHSLTNRHPGRIARALSRWTANLPAGDFGDYVIDFLAE